MGKVLVLPIGDVPGGILDVLSGALKAAFMLDVRQGRAVAIPKDAYDHTRRQYRSSVMREALMQARRDRDDTLLGVSDVDLYAPSLNFVFGEADPSTGVAVISLTRLRQEYYGLPEDEELFRLRATKEAVHEVGHVFGLAHCPDPRCVMHFSNSLPDTDRKGPGFCARCKGLLSQSRA